MISKQLWTVPTHCHPVHLSQLLCTHPPVIRHILTNSGTFLIMWYILTHSDTPICSPIHPSLLRYTLSHLPFCNLVIHHTPIHLSVLWWIIPYSGITTCTPNHWSTLRYVYLHLCAKLYIFLYSDTALGTLVYLSIIRYSVLPFNFPYLDLFYLPQKQSIYMR